MSPAEFLNLYKKDGLIQTIAAELKPNDGHRIRIRGLSGSLDAVLAAAVFSLNHQSQLFVLHDKEEAAYFFNDLQGLVGKKEALFYPTSYKRPYEYDELENANVLQRSEILNRINHRSAGGEMIITYPEALSEKVINKKSLKAHTLKVEVGEELDLSNLGEQLASYEFEKKDFVYDAGQYAQRGGIIDIFSYSYELPYRIELFGHDVESIRTFDPVNQLSIEEKKSIQVIPNVEKTLILEERESFLKFLPVNTKVWIKDFDLTLDTLTKSYEKAHLGYENQREISGSTSVICSPDKLFETSNSFLRELDRFRVIEFGQRFTRTEGRGFIIESQPQPSFHKKFELIAQTLDINSQSSLENILVSESPGQLDRLQAIFSEIDPEISYHSLNLSLRAGFTDRHRGIACYTDHQLFERFHRYRVKDKTRKSKALTIKELQALHPGDFVTHIDHGIGRFAGLVEVPAGNNGHTHQEAIRLVYKDDDILYVNIHSLHKISRYSGKEGTIPPISKLGSTEWENKKKRVKKRVSDIARDLIKLYAKRKNAPGYAFSKDGFLQAELESSFLFEDTPDQNQATVDTKRDMEQTSPMDRLICGDVGFGKTEVAIRAAFKAVSDGKQVAVLVPTTILAFQHFHTFSERLKNFPVSIDYVNRFKSTKSVREILGKTSSGDMNILIGTHRIVSKDVKFKNLGLLIIDEEQKFGVKVKEKLKEMRVNVDTLTLTATPIPRTLHFSLMGARDLSVISTPPPNRQPVSTRLQVFDEYIVRDAISFELRRGGQVFFVHNRIQDIDEIANIVVRLVPDARVGIAHGRMDGNKLEKVMIQFIERGYDVLVSTNIIESGLDIPNANTIIINQAHMYGLSELHQMRGRVGRSNRKAFCYLLSPPTIGLSSDARKRLSTLEEFSELGDGFKVAMRDLDIRGAGNLLGAEQSGFISDLGFDTYHKILDDAVKELKEAEFKDLFKDELNGLAQTLSQDCVFESDLEILIPESYVANITERLALYTQLDTIKDESALEQFVIELEDRFGPVPEPVNALLESVRLRWLAISLGFEKLTLKGGRLKGYFIPSSNEIYYKGPMFGQVLKFVQQHQRQCQMRETHGKLFLRISDISDIESAKAVLSQMNHYSS